MTKREYVGLKALGGIVATITLPFVILALIRDVPPGGGDPPPLSAALLPGALGLLGFALFMLGDRGLKALEREQQASTKGEASG